MARTLALVPLALLALAAPASAQQSPTPTPTSTAPTVNCPYVEFSADRHTIAPGETVTITATRVTNAPDQRVGAELQRRFPAPEAVVRSEGSTATVVTWPVRLGESHQFVGISRPDRSNCRPLGRPDGIPFTVDVQPTVGIAAVRNTTRDYSFSGRVVPGRGQRVVLYRVTDTGSRVLTSTGNVRPDGTYRFDRRFSGAGRFGFQVDVAATASNLGGQSDVRPTVIH